MIHTTLKTIIIACLLSGSFLLEATPVKVVKSDSATAVEEEVLKPHDYILLPQNLPCVAHFFEGNTDRLHITKEQNAWLGEVHRSPIVPILRLKAEEIRRLEHELRALVYAGQTPPDKLKPKLDRIAALRVDLTLEFIGIQFK
ncbi:MAG: hypothetical protein JW706_03175, partial [Opitutales bacterium]|nr:hypothetical protein [Opitutales bacterium]